MDVTLQSGSLKIASVMGIPIRVHFSWLIIFGLITWSLSTYYFPTAAPELPGMSYWISGVLAALLLFLSVVLHELSHSFVARRYGIAIAGITLFIFGGVAQMKGEPRSPGVEAKMALAGPLASFVIALIFLAAGAMAAPQAAKALFQYLFRLNIILGVFNLIPGFPMDGGRVVRAFLWQKTGNYLEATRRASNYGQKISIFFIILGLFSVFAGAAGGLWLMLIGWFLYTAAQSSHQQASFQEMLEGVKVKDIMVRDVVAVLSHMTVDTVVNEYFLRYGYGGFPVVDNGKFLGLITLKELKQVPKEKWKDVKVSEIFIQHDGRWEAAEEDDALKILELMMSADKGRLAVIGNGGLKGLITKNGIAKYIYVAGEVKK
ncbi:MAG: site-2 protease family protein [Thermodesulfovibrionales bacterium]|nr:site-2 protease family protein [Thermodesulfovibrionales bacterium]